MEIVAKGSGDRPTLVAVTQHIVDDEAGADISARVDVSVQTREQRHRRESLG